MNRDNTDESRAIEELRASVEDLDSSLSEIKDAVCEMAYKEDVYHSEVGTVCPLKVIVSQALVTGADSISCRVTLFDVPEKQRRYFDCDYLLVSRYSYEEANFCETIPFTTLYPPLEEFMNVCKKAIAHLEEIRDMNQTMS